MVVAGWGGGGGGFLAGMLLGGSTLVLVGPGETVPQLGYPVLEGPCARPDEVEALPDFAEAGHYGG